MKLRELNECDAPLMLEWMHDKNVVEKLRGDFSGKTINDCNLFIKNANNKNNIHLAIVSDENIYMGTVSLKNIDLMNSFAEFAIVVRSCAMGKGYSWFGMKEIIKIAFDSLGLNSIYWCVSSENIRALKFYNKHDFVITSNVPKEILKEYDESKNLKWYFIKRTVEN